MTGSVALDVVIGLVFIYLLYSLFATVIMEIVNTLCGLRARNLRYALRRMLKDEKHTKWYLERVLYKVANFLAKQIGFASNLKNDGLFKAFYDQPSIKYLSAGGFANKPSYIAPQNFSKTIIDAIKENYYNNVILNNLDDLPEILDEAFKSETGVLRLKEKFEKRKNKNQSLADWFNGLEVADKIQGITEVVQVNQGLKKQFQELKDSAKEGSLLEKIKGGIASLPENSDTKKHLESLLVDAQNDLEKFTFFLEQWFDDTMERARGWFKRRVQYFLFIIGFFLAVSFNANTVDIIKKLSADPEAREQLVQLAIEYSQELNEQGQVENKDSSQDEATKSDEIERIQKTIDSLQKEAPESDEIKRLQKIRDSLQKVAAESDQIERFQKTKDSLQKVAKKLEGDIENAQNIIATNWHIPDDVAFYTDSLMATKKNKLKSNNIDSVIIQMDLKINHKIKGRDTAFLMDKAGKIISITKQNYKRKNLVNNGNGKKETLVDSIIMPNKDTMWFGPDTILKRWNKIILQGSKKGYFKIHKSLDTVLFKKCVPSVDVKTYNAGLLRVKKGKYKRSHAFDLNNFWGYFLTALAISLGSPFWFDLLNKLIVLRNSIRPRKSEAREKGTSGNTNNGVSIKDRVG